MLPTYEGPQKAMAAAPVAKAFHPKIDLHIYRCVRKWIVTNNPGPAYRLACHQNTGANTPLMKPSDISFRGLIDKCSIDSVVMMQEGISQTKERGGMERAGEERKGV